MKTLKLVVLAGAFALLLTAAKCPTECDTLKGIMKVECTLDPTSVRCTKAIEEYRVKCEPGPGPTPTPTPTPEPTPTPTPTPEPTPTPTPTPECPWAFPPNAYRIVGIYGAGHGFNVTPQIKGSAAYCKARGWTDGRSVCAVAQEGDPNRLTCELQFFGGCPIWEFYTAINPTIRACNDNHNAEASCDHFGVQPHQDDPQTPTTGNTLATLKGFEGEPKICGLQRDAFGPLSGFFAIAHGDGYIRACPADKKYDNECSGWLYFNK